VLIILVISFSKRENQFHEVCPFCFNDICNKKDLSFGCVLGKKAQADNLKEANNSIARNIDF